LVDNVRWQTELEDTEAALEEAVLEESRREFVQMQEELFRQQLMMHGHEGGPRQGRGGVAEEGQDSAKEQM